MKLPWVGHVYVLDCPYWVHTCSRPGRAFSLWRTASCNNIPSFLHVHALLWHSLSPGLRIYEPRQELEFPKGPHALSGFWWHQKQRGDTELQHETQWEGPPIAESFYLFHTNFKDIAPQVFKCIHLWSSHFNLALITVVFHRYWDATELVNMIIHTKIDHFYTKEASQKQGFQVKRMDCQRDWNIACLSQFILTGNDPWTWNTIFRQLSLPKPVKAVE